jgi:hypothetical protein
MPSAVSCRPPYTAPALLRLTTIGQRRMWPPSLLSRPRPDAGRGNPRPALAAADDGEIRAEGGERFHSPWRRAARPRPRAILKDAPNRAALVVDREVCPAQIRRRSETSLSHPEGHEDATLLCALSGMIVYYRPRRPGERPDGGGSQSLQEECELNLPGGVFYPASVLSSVQQ